MSLCDEKGTNFQACKLDRRAETVIEFCEKSTGLNSVRGCNWPVI